MIPAVPPEQDASPGGGKASSILVIVLNFNGLADTLACLDSLAAQIWPRFDVLVVDNGSVGDEAARIAAHPSGPEVLALAENTGWAGGNNAGLRLALDRGYGHACLLNNDTVLDPDALQELAAAAASLGRPCLLHPAIAYYDDPGRWQLRPDPPDGSPAEWPDPAWDIVELDFAYGACLMIPAAVLRQLGLLDERFFLQLEEVDYYMRAKAQGLRSFCARRARILHKESATFGALVTPTKLYYQVRNSFLLTEKHTPTPMGFARTARDRLWTMHRRAQDGGVKRGWGGVLRWMVSADPLAKAAREGAGDYLRRRFGRRRTSEARPAP